MKKFICLLLALSLMLFSSACSADPNGGADGALKVGIIQLADNGAFTDMREGFIDRMRELGYTEDKMVFDYKNAQGDMSVLNTICQDMASSDLDFIVTIATPPTQAMVNLDPGVPVFFISVSNPVGAGVISELSFPDKNATGTSNAIPVGEMFKLADQLTPGIKTYGFLYNTSEINSATTIEQAKEYLDSVNISYKEAIVTSSADVQQAAQSLIGEVDAIFVPNDSMVQSALPQAAEVCKDAGIPLYGSSAVMVNSGAFATISIDDITIGGMTADMAKTYLDGTPITEIPAIVVSEFTTVINQTTADAIEAELSEEVLSAAVIVK